MEKRYGLITAIAMVIGNVIGSGVFVKGGKVLSLTGGNMLQAVLVAAIVGLICIICSLVFAELGARCGKVNGVVDYAENALGSGYAYYVGWFMATVYYPAMSSIVAFFAAVFTLRLFGVNALDFANGTISTEAVGLGAGYLIMSYGLNAISPRLAGKMQVSMTVIKLIPLLLMGIVGTAVGLSNGTTQAVLNEGAVNGASQGGGIAGMLSAITAFAFSYEGWIIATSINGELKNAKKNLPIALITGSVVCTVIYCLYLFSMSAVGSTEAIIATWPLGESLPELVFSAVFGRLAGTLVYVFVTVSCLGTLNGFVMGSCRGMYAVAARGEGPRPEFFGEVDSQNGFVIKSSLIGLMLGGFWYAWNCTLWMKGPDFMGGLHNNMWIGWEPDEICVVNLYAMYIPMFASLMVQAKDLNVFKRFIMPGLGILCCLFMVFCCYVGKGFRQVTGYLVFLAVVMLIGRLFRGKTNKTEKFLENFS